MSIPGISILGSGWLGLPLALHLQGRGHALRVSTTRLSRQAELNAQGLEAHLVDIDELDDSVAAFLQSDILICNITAKSIDSYRKLLRKVEGSPISKVLFISTTSVYANANKMVSESDGLLENASPWLAIEQLFSSSTSFETTILRFAGLVGYSRNPANFFKAGRPMRDPDAPVNLIHRDDCINIIERIVAESAWGEVFNACADTHPSKREFYTQVARQCGLPLPEIVQHKETGFKIISNQKLKDVLHYRFVHADLMTINFQLQG